jgi:hypothetical protein
MAVSKFENSIKPTKLVLRNRILKVLGKEDKEKMRAA